MRAHLPCGSQLLLVRNTDSRHFLLTGGVYFSISCHCFWKPGKFRGMNDCALPPWLPCMLKNNCDHALIGLVLAAAPAPGITGGRALFGNPEITSGRTQNCLEISSKQTPLMKSMTGSDLAGSRCSNLPMRSYHTLWALLSL